MRTLRRITAAGIALTAVVAGLGTGTALADPPSGSTPASNSIVGVGSDTDQYLFDRFATDYNATSPVNPLASWDADGLSPIVPKAGCAAIARPDGTGQGFQALAARQVVNGVPCIDFARAGLAPQAANPTGYVFAAFARDATTWAATSRADGGHAPAGASLTFAQLSAVYTCHDPATGGPYRWSDLFAGASNDEIVPVLPGTNDDLRALFLAQLGHPVVGSCVVNATGTTDLEDNEGTNPAFFEANGTTPNPDVIVPYSIGNYIAEVDTRTVTAFEPGDLVLEDLTNGNGVAEAPIAGSGSTATISLNLPAPAYALLYNITPNAGTTNAPALPAYLLPLFGTTAQGGWICENGGTDIRAYGFLTIAQCGALTDS
jgi:ABC-type phosphate transport system substrate-binding protein